MTAHTEPASLIAGDTAKWLISSTDYPATDGWVMTYTLINSAERYTFTSTASGADHLINVAASDTARWAPGSYSWRCQAIKSPEAYTLRSGTLSVQSAFTDTDIDARSHARKALANIEAYLENANNLSAASYEISGRKLQRWNIPDLLTMRSRYQAEVSREDNADRIRAGLGSRNTIQTRFTSR